MVTLKTEGFKKSNGFLGLFCQNHPHQNKPGRRGADYSHPSIILKPLG
jgi:hypothetical protein